MVGAHIKAKEKAWVNPKSSLLSKVLYGRMEKS